MNFSQDEIDEFKSDAAEMLDGAERDLLALDKGGDIKSLYDSIFRVFHSLKGGAGMTGLFDLQDHMHKLENLLIQCKTSNATMRANVTFFLDGVDAARKILGGERVKFSFTLAGSNAPTGSTTEIPAQTKTQPLPAPEQIKTDSASAPAQAKASLVASTNQVAAENLKFLASEPVAYVVDDEPEILEYLSSVLENAKIRGQTFTEPEKMLEVLAKKKPDLILTDMLMPRMNGIQVLQKVKAIDFDLPVIFLSGHLSKSVLMDAINSGLYGAIEKPFKDADVITQCLNATREFRLARLLNQSLNLLLYQFSDLDDFLAKQGRDEVRSSIKTELEALLNIRRLMRTKGRTA